MIWDLHTYLMVDWDLVAEQTNTSMVREEPFKYEGNPLIRLEDTHLTLDGRPLTGRAFGISLRLLVKEGSIYRLWYAARPHVKSRKRPPRLQLQYAESADGVHFKPVRVGQVRWRGSKDNNLIDVAARGEQDARPTGFLHDPLDAEYPYKCVYQRPASGDELEPGVAGRWPFLKDREWRFVWGIGRSRDGFAWESPAHEHNLVNAAPESAHLHRAMDGGLVISDQMVNPMAEMGGRNVKGWVTYDLETAHRIPDFLFSLPAHMCRVNAAFNTGAAWDRSAWAQPHVGLVCARKGPTMVALHGYLYGATAAETFAQVADVGLACSATGIGFREVWPFRPFIRRGMRGSWDYGMTAQRFILDAGDETRFYYIGGDVGNLCSNYLPGLATIPRDRYGYRMIEGHRDTAKRDRRATLALKPCALPDRPAFAVNVSHVTRSRTVRLELADEKGRAIPGYRFENCVPVAREGLRQRVRWKPNRTGEELKGRRVVIRAELFSPNCGAVYYDSPRLYAVYTHQQGD